MHYPSCQHCGRPNSIIGKRSPAWNSVFRIREQSYCYNRSSTAHKHPLPTISRTSASDLVPLLHRAQSVNWSSPPRLLTFRRLRPQRLRRQIVLLRASARIATRVRSVEVRRCSPVPTRAANAQSPLWTFPEHRLADQAPRADRHPSLARSRPQEFASHRHFRQKTRWVCGFTQRAGDRIGANVSRRPLRARFLTASHFFGDLNGVSRLRH